MSFDKHKNLAISVVAVAPSPASSGLALTLVAGGGALMPEGVFDGLVWPAGAQPSLANAEIVRVESTSGDHIALSARAQGGTSARPIQVGDQFANAITVKAFTDLEAAIEAAKGEVATEKTRAEAAEAAKLAKAENLKDLANAATARTNLGLGSAAVEPASAFDAKGEAAAEKTRAQAAEALLAPLASPALTGTPTAPTQAEGDNSTKLATTAFAHGVAATAQATAEAASIPLTQKGAANGVATLDGEGHLSEGQVPPSVVRSSAKPTAKGQRLVAEGTVDETAIWLPSAEFDVREYSSEIKPNVEEDQAAHINAFMKELPAGATVLLPEANPQVEGGVSRYFCGSAIEIQKGVAIRGMACDRSVFSALTGFVGHQLMRNWAAADGTAFGVAPNTTAAPLYHPMVRNIGLDLRGQSELMALALVHPQERANLENIALFTNYGRSEFGTNNIGLALFANNDAAGTAAGRFDIVHLVGYGGGWLHWIFADGTNNGTTTNWIRDIVIRGFTSPTGPADGTICSSSPIHMRAVDGLQLIGHCEAMPPSNSEDTAVVRLIDVTRDDLSQMRISPGGNTMNRPAVRATQTGTAPGFYPMSSPSLRSINLYRENESAEAKGWTRREDEGCTITAGSTTVTNAKAKATDLHLPVEGAGIVPGTIITEVVAGEKWVLSQAAIATGTVSLTRTAHIVEDEMGGKSRLWTYDPAYFDPRYIYEYTGSVMDWVNGAGSTPTRRRARRQAADSAALLDPEGIVAATLPRGRVALTGTSVFASGKLWLSPLLLFPGDTIKKFKVATASTASKNLTHSWMALFGPRKELLGISADGLATEWAASANHEVLLETPVTATLAAVYFVGICIVGETMPNVQGVSAAVVNSSAPVLNGLSTEGLTTPGSCPLVAGAIAVNNGTPYITAS